MVSQQARLGVVHAAARRTCLFRGMSPSRGHPIRFRNLQGKICVENVCAWVHVCVCAEKKQTAMEKN